ncbi:MAG: TauD/TfdA family dioxygenase [Alphaproteobacteria bacterium]|jgi:hypothetical protein|nr:TauD/TfdA family dioxygenase [Rhodospirillaceae bacterium]MBT6508953.1 TauD/TfdA family dioxygenase [Rhodospirillaceae bacterium]MBT7646465.1 TauD/TfdA family dioxygenase [Rhodospirillaceae bacterium]MDG2481690.1 TauD/TfdA family dioxygenase [Alphaproteobacteria bacterium]
MAQTYTQEVAHPSAWTATGLGSVDSIKVAWKQRHIDALEEAYEQVAARGLTLDQVEHEHFLLPSIAADLRAIYEEVMWGRGIVLVDRLPVEDWSLEKAEIIYWGIGTHFGKGQSQSVMGDRLGHVVNVGGKDPKERAYRNSLPLTLHTDACDILGMLSIRAGETGGESQYASAVAVHNAILEEKPEYLEPLYRGFRYHRFGEEGPGEAPVTEHHVPVLSERDGYVTCRYVAGYIYMAYEELGEELSDTDRDALGYFDDVALRPEMKLEFMMQPGQMLLANNHTVLHARSGFEDTPGADTGRMLLRLWLTAHEGERRPIDETIEIYRARGIDPQSRNETRYRGDATKVLKPGVLKY